MNILHSIGAVFAGLVAVFVLSEGTDYIFRATGVFPDKEGAFTNEIFVVAFAYRALAGVIGGYVTAALSPNRAIVHALALGFIGLALGAAGAVLMWGVGPAWYPIALAVVAPPAAWLGGWLHQRRGMRANTNP